MELSIKNTYKIKTLTDLEAVALSLLKDYPDTRTFIFEGNLGAGKTTFIQALCKCLGVKEQVTSPTYALVNEYQGAKSPILHFDLYRLNSERELLDIGFESYLSEETAYIFIEWPELALPFLEQAVLVKIAALEDEERLLEVGSL